MHLLHFHSVLVELHVYVVFIDLIVLVDDHLILIKLSILSIIV